LILKRQLSRKAAKNARKSRKACSRLHLFGDAFFQIMFFSVISVVSATECFYKVDRNYSGLPLSTGVTKRAFKQTRRPPLPRQCVRSESVVDAVLNTETVSNPSCAPCAEAKRLA
jgi:hypothetical protein